jgi:hypothetical protein
MADRVGRGTYFNPDVIVVVSEAVKNVVICYLIAN